MAFIKTPGGVDVTTETPTIGIFTNPFSAVSASDFLISNFRTYRVLTGRITTNLLGAGGGNLELTFNSFVPPAIPAGYLFAFQRANTAIQQVVSGQFLGLTGNTYLFSFQFTAPATPGFTFDMMFYV